MNKLEPFKEDIYINYYKILQEKILLISYLKAQGN